MTDAKYKHIVIFALAFVLYASVIWLLSSSISLYAQVILLVCGIALGIYLAMIVRPSWKSRLEKLEQEREQLRQAKAEFRKRLEEDKTFDFYCSKCLYQTNEEAKYCPRCKEGEMKRTAKKLSEQGN